MTVQKCYTYEDNMMGFRIRSNNQITGYPRYEACGFITEVGAMARDHGKLISSSGYRR